MGLVALPGWLARLVIAGGWRFGPIGNRAGCPSGLASAVGNSWRLAFWSNWGSAGCLSGLASAVGNSGQLAFWSNWESAPNQRWRLLIPFHLGRLLPPPLPPLPPAPVPTPCSRPPLAPPLPLPSSSHSRSCPLAILKPTRSNLKMTRSNLKMTRSNLKMTRRHCI